MIGYQKPKFDIQKRQQYAFEASVDNVKMGNDAIKASQNWLLILGLAELSFLGAVLLKDGGNNYLIKILVVALLLAFSLFIAGSLGQYKHLLRSARQYDEISRKAVDGYLKKGITTMDEVPGDLELPARQIMSNSTTNHLVAGAYILVLFVTLAIIPIIFGI